MSGFIDWDIDTVGGFILGVWVSMFIAFYYLHKNQEEMKKDIKQVRADLRSQKVANDGR